MPLFTHVLAPIDFGEMTDDVIDVAIGMARKFDVPLTVTHAFFIEPFAYANGFYVPIEEVMREARTTLDAAVDKIRERYPKVDGVLAHGDPSQEILRVAKTQKADLIVMATHGRCGLSRVLLGSVAEKVVRLSPVPVLTVSGRHAPEKKEEAQAETSG